MEKIASEPAPGPEQPSAELEYMTQTKNVLLEKLKAIREDPPATQVSGGVSVGESSLSESSNDDESGDLADDGSEAGIA